MKLFLTTNTHKQKTRALSLKVAVVLPRQMSGIIGSINTYTPSNIPESLTTLFVLKSNQTNTETLQLRLTFHKSATEVCGRDRKVLLVVGYV